MEKNTRKFPDGFLWGAATASYQVEGGIENTDWAKAAREGRVPPAGRLADHYNRYEEDFDIAKSLGHNAHRFSIEWARIEPEEGKFDEKEIKHYRKVLVALHERGLSPFVTMHHFTLPLWFSESGGWERKDAHTLFARYCKRIADAFSDYCTSFATINEPIVMTNNGWVRGNWPPFKKLHIGDFFKVTRAMAKAHNEAYRLIKTDHPHLEVGIVKDNIYFHTSRPYLNWLVKLMDWYWDLRFLNMVRDSIDSIGLNYYFHKEFGGVRSYPKNDMGWDLYPEGIYHELLELRQFNVPLYVAESGIADADDDQRGKYIRDLVGFTLRAIKDGADVRAFMYWSLIDNYEWALGTEKRFGLVEIDYETLERKVRPSAYVYKKIIEQNGEVE